MYFDLRGIDSSNSTKFCRTSQCRHLGAWILQNCFVLFPPFFLLPSFCPGAGSLPKILLNSSLQAFSELCQLPSFEPEIWIFLLPVKIIHLKLCLRPQTWCVILALKHHFSPQNKWINDVYTLNWKKIYIHCWLQQYSHVSYAMLFLAK